MLGEFRQTGVNKRYCGCKKISCLQEAAGYVNCYPEHNSEYVLTLQKYAYIIKIFKQNYTKCLT